MLNRFFGHIPKLHQRTSLTFVHSLPSKTKQKTPATQTPKMIKGTSRKKKRLAKSAYLGLQYWTRDLGTQYPICGVSFFLIRHCHTCRFALTLLFFLTSRHFIFPIIKVDSAVVVKKVVKGREFMLSLSSYENIASLTFSSVLKMYVEVLFLLFSLRQVYDPRN